MQEMHQFEFYTLKQEHLISRLHGKSRARIPQDVAQASALAQFPNRTR
jgi:hypothetical protein